MAKKDPFEKFRQATLGGKTESPLKAALEQEPRSAEPTDTRTPVRTMPAQPESVQEQVSHPETDGKEGKNANRDLVSFHLDKELKKHLGFLKFETGKSYNDLYVEAVEELLKKYGKL